MRPAAVISGMLLLSAAAAWAAGDGPGDPARAVDQVVTGTVVHARADGSAVALAFDDNPSSVRIILLRGWMDDFPPDPAHYYLGKTVQVHGTVTRFHGAPEIIVRDAANIVVVGPSKAPAPVAAPSPDEVQALRERLRRLEERVRELERREAERKDPRR